MSSMSWPPEAPALEMRLDPADRRLLIVPLAMLSFWALVLLVQRYDAAPVLTAAVALLAAVPLLRRPELATMLTVFLLYVNFPAILTKQHGVPTVLAGSFILLLAIPMVRLLALRRQPLRSDPALRLMGVLLVVYLVASFRSIDGAIAAERILTYALEGLLVFWLVLNVIRTRRTLRRVVWTLLAAGGLLGTLSLYQEVTGAYDQEFGGLAHRDYVEVQDEVDRDGPERRESWDRAQGPLNEPNRYAQVLIVLLPLALFCHRTARNRRARLWAAGLGLMIFAGVVLTLSRGAIVTIVLLGVAILALGWVRSPRTVVVGLAAAALAAVLLAPRVPFLMSRVESITRAGSVLVGEPGEAVREADGAMLGRMTLMLSALHVFLDHPVIGVGPGQFPPFYSMDYSESVEMDLGDLRHGNWRAHSLYLEIAAETGVIGLAVFLGIVGGLARRLWRARTAWRRRDAEAADLATALCLSLLAYLTTGIFLHLSYERYYWFLLALAAAALHVLQARQRATPSPGTQMLPAPRTRHLPATSSRCLPSR